MVSGKLLGKVEAEYLQQLDLGDRKAVALEPDLVERKEEAKAIRRATKLARGGSFDESVAVLKDAGARYPWSAQVQHRLGRLARHNGDEVQALQHFRAALLLDPELPSVVADYCYYLHRRGDSRKAVNILNLRLALRPDDKAVAAAQRMIAAEMSSNRLTLTNG